LDKPTLIDVDYAMHFSDALKYFMIANGYCPNINEGFDRYSSSAVFFHEEI